MASMNKVFIIGNLGRDPELRTTGEGQSVCSFRVATTEGKRSEERTEWHNVVCWGRTAEASSQYLKKGSQVLIEGRIQSSTYETKAGEKRYKTEIIASRVEFLTPRAQAA